MADFGKICAGLSKQEPTVTKRDLPRNSPHLNPTDPISIAGVEVLRPDQRIPGMQLESWHNNNGLRPLLRPVAGSKLVAARSCFIQAYCLAWPWLPSWQTTTLDLAAKSKALHLNWDTKQANNVCLNPVLKSLPLPKLYSSMQIPPHGSRAPPLERQIRLTYIKENSSEGKRKEAASWLEEFCLFWIELRCSDRER